MLLRQEAAHRANMQPASLARRVLLDEANDNEMCTTVNYFSESQRKLTGRSCSATGGVS